MAWPRRKSPLQFPTHPVHGFFDQSVSRYPEVIALIQAGPNFDRRITYSQLGELSDRFAASLIRRGLRPGDRVAVILPNCPQFVITA